MSGTKQIAIKGRATSVLRTELSSWTYSIVGRILSFLPTLAILEEFNSFPVRRDVISWHCSTFKRLQSTLNTCKSNAVFIISYNLYSLRIGASKQLTRKLIEANFSKIWIYRIFSIIRHSMMRWNLTSKKFPTDTEYGVWKLILCSFTYQSQKNPFS